MRFEMPMLRSWLGLRSTQDVSVRLMSLIILVSLAIPIGGDEHRKPKLKTGGQVFLLSAISHDDMEQWVLIPHFVAHYTGQLGVRPENYLLILHSDAQNTTGIANMAWWLQQAYGIVNTFPVTKPYTSRLHFEVKVGILLQHVTPKDWVLQVDADEFVFYKGCPLQGIYRFLDQHDAEGINVHYGLMVDRVAADGDVDLAPVAGPESLFAQYPVNCAVTILLQSSDVRKATAYKGHLRPTTGNHNVIGMNQTGYESGLEDMPTRVNFWLKRLHKYVGNDIFSKLPYVKDGWLPRIKPLDSYATIYHFKWIRGLAAKMYRRAETEAYTVGQYQEVREALGQTRRFDERNLRRMCNWWDLPTGPTDNSLPRPLTSRELMQLFMVIKPVQVDDILKHIDVGEQEAAMDHLLSKALSGAIARESAIPVD